MSDIGRTLITIGVVCLFLGGLISLIGKIPGAGKLPGDVIIKKENFTFYFPLATCLILSLILSLILFFVNKR